MRKRAVKPNRVVMNVHSEHAQGLRRRNRHLLFCPSTMLSEVMSLAGGPGGAAAWRGFSLDMAAVGAAVAATLD